MDLSLVALGIWALVIIPVAGGDDGLGFERLLVFRGLRLLRLVRALRMVSHFKIMWRRSTFLRLILIDLSIFKFN